MRRRHAGPGCPRSAAEDFITEDVEIDKRIGMQVGVHTGDLRSLTADALVVPVYTGGEVDPATKAVDALLDGAIARAVGSGEVTGTTYERTIFHVPRSAGAGFTPRAVLAVGLGAMKDLDAVTVGRYAGAAVRYLGKRKYDSIAVALPAAASKTSKNAKPNAGHAAQRIAEIALTATFDTTTHRSKAPDDRVVTTRVVLYAPGGDAQALSQALARGRVIGDGVNLARILANAPPAELTPEAMAGSARTVAKQVGLGFDVLEPKQMEQL
ncbi:MAG: hypothetical protein KGM44_04990, partial [bacterium]|nr:hypothetical protein [bacterium]